MLKSYVAASRPIVMKDSSEKNNAGSGTSASDYLQLQGRQARDVDRTQQPRHGFTETEVTRRLIIAVFERRLPPGARITEVQLAGAFQVSRTVVRQSMNKLSELGVFKKVPNLGYTIAAPSRSETEMMLDLRDWLEPVMVRNIAVKRTAADLRGLQNHLEQEALARAANNNSTLLRLTGEFHLKLAEISRNRYLTRLMMQLQLLTCLAVIVHAEKDKGCPRDEHSLIVDAIAHGDGERAAAEMAHHLRHIRNELQLDRTEPEADLENAFRWLGAAQI